MSARHGMARVPWVDIILLNWNAWRHTLECLESLFRLDYPAYRVIVCDNASSDDSLEHIADWAEGREPAPVPEDGRLAGLASPPVPKPVSWVRLERAGAEVSAGIPAEARLVLVQTGANLGFAGGCNVGLRCALASGAMDYTWLLNNDTVVTPSALRELVGTAEATADVGITGSTLAYYDAPDQVQALGGGRYNPWNGFAKNVGEFGSVGEAVARAQAPAPEYVHGASMLVSRAFLEQVGLMAEEFFLYFEELDWACRGKARFAMAYASRSLVYHKEGATIGTKGKAVGRSRLSDYYMLRNRFRINAKYFPWALPTLYLWVPMMLASRMANRQWDRLSSVLRAALWLDAGSVRPEA